MTEQTQLELPYEQALQELETIVAALEDDGRPLEESLALFERAQLLSRHCASLLDQAELKVQQIAGEDLVPTTINSER
jgi:exodeoxyribonuclease VII small subunit